MTNTSVHFFDEPHVMQPGSVAESLSGFAAHLTAQGYQSLSVSNYLWSALHFRGMDRLKPNPTCSGLERNPHSFSEPLLSMSRSPKAKTRFSALRSKDSVLP